MDALIKMELFTIWALLTFKNATAESSLKKLEEEIKEVRETPTAEEYADCMMCIIDSAARSGFSPKTLMQAFIAKCDVNMQREWIEIADGTYSHKK